MKTHAFLMAGVALGACIAVPAHAQATDQSNSTSLEEIVVTAQRTSQSLQQVPIAVTAVTSADLANRQITSSLNLEAAVSNLTLTQNGVSVTPFLRGVGSNQSNPNDEASVATYIDGVYIPSVTGNIFKFNNVERIEVLKGPQGTLFGRNATGGVIQIITRDPSHDPLLDASIGIGTKGTVEASAYASAGLGETAAIDIAASFDRNGGYGKDINRNADIFKHNQLGLRSKLLWTPGATTEIRLSADYSRLNSTGTDYQLRQGVIGVDGVTSYPGKRKTNTDWKNIGDNDIYGASLRVDQDLDFARLVSITGYRHVKGNFHLDQDATPFPLVQADINQFAESYSQEVQLLSPKSSKVDWLLGGYYFHAKYAYTPLTIGGLAAFPLPSIDLFGDQKTDSYSAYGQVTYPILENTKITAGLRYTHEKQDTNGRTESGGVAFPHPDNPDHCPGAITDCPQSQSINKLTWRVAIDQQFSDDVLGYISYNRGIKSGGFNMINAGTDGYRPEILDAYEAGLKMQFLDRRVRLNMAAFIYDYQDIQVFNITGGGAVLTTNAAAARVHGFDGDLTIKASQNLTLSAGVGILDGQYTDFPNATFTPASPLDGPQVPGDATGNRMIYAPKFSSNATIDYRIPTSMGEFGINASVSQRSKIYVSAANRLAIPGYAVVNGSLSWTSNDEHFGVQLWARNLFNRDYYINRTEQALGDIQFLAPPRTIGVTLSLKTR